MWLEEAIGRISYPEQHNVLEFTLRTQGSAIGHEYMRFVGIMNEDRSSVSGTFEGGLDAYGKDIAGTWYAVRP